jgi:uncharacterized protein involved in type VI secretion and phage assembly
VNDASDPLVRAFAPQSAQHREQRVHGLVTARVEKIEDDGTYRLKFFGMNGQDDDDVSAPARVMMPMAGGKRGVHSFPEPGDEVGRRSVRRHEQPDHPRRRLEPTRSRPIRPSSRRATTSDDRHAQRSELTFDDTAGAEKVTLKSQGGHSIVLDDAPARPDHARRRWGKPSSRRHAAWTHRDPDADVSRSRWLAGVVSIQATTSITLNAPSITLADGGRRRRRRGHHDIDNIRSKRTSTREERFFGMPRPARWRCRSWRRPTKLSWRRVAIC